MARNSTEKGRGWVKAVRAAEYCDVSKKTFLDWVRDNPDLPAKRVGGSILVNLDRLDEWLLNRPSANPARETAEELVGSMI